MCLIIHKPAGVDIPEERLRAAFQRNSDGWGMMRLSQSKKPLHAKGVGTFEEFYKIYLAHYAKGECGIHFRIGTSGNKDKDNCHPFKVTDQVMLMHNGILSGFPMDNKDMNDTWHFAQMLAPMIDKGGLRDTGFQRLISHFIGAGNKLLMLDPDGFMIFNKGAGTEYQGCWYSNTIGWGYPTTTTYYYGGYHRDDDTTWFNKNSKKGGSSKDIITTTAGQSRGTRFISAREYKQRIWNGNEEVRGEDLLKDENSSPIPEPKAVSQKSADSTTAKAETKPDTTTNEQSNTFERAATAVSEARTLVAIGSNDTELVSGLIAQGEQAAAEEHAIDNTLREVSLSAVEPSDDAIETCDETQSPEIGDLGTWVGLDRDKIREIAQKNPETVADQLFDLMQGFENVRQAG